MAGATQRKQPPLSRETFRAFTASRPDEERWQLIDGVAVMVTPPTKAHQRTKPDDLLALPDFGLHCKVADLYRGTALQPRQVPKR